MYSGMKAKFASVLTALAFAGVLSGVAQVTTDSEFEVGGIRYRVRSGTSAVVVGYTSDVPSNVVIGQGVRYDGHNYWLSGVEAGAFAGCTEMRTLTFSAIDDEHGALSFTIGDKAFDTPTIEEVVMMRPVPTVSGDPFSAETYADGVLKVSTALTEEQQKAYETTEPWNRFFENDHGIVTGVHRVDCGGDGAVVEVYTLSGVRVYSGAADKMALQHGIYLVRSGGDVGKVAM